jgi:uncharacterized protein YjbI with pentapeptide repeats
MPFSKKPSIKIQSILNLLFVDENERKTYAHLHANLFDAYLPGVNLSQAVFLDANFSGVNLKGANLNRTQFNSTKLIYTNFTDANLTSASIKFSFLNWAILNNAKLMGSKIFGSHFQFTNLDGALISEKDWFQKLINSECKGVDKLDEVYSLEEEERKDRTCYRITKLQITQFPEEHFSIE